jgi:hypothetical protein
VHLERRIVRRVVLESDIRADSDIEVDSASGFDFERAKHAQAI